MKVTTVINATTADLENPDVLIKTTIKVVSSDNLLKDLVKIVISDIAFYCSEKDLKLALTNAMNFNPAP